MKKKNNNDTMKLMVIYLIIIALLIFFSSCNTPIKPDFAKDGKEYVVRENCVKYHWVSDYGYHYGYNIMSGKYEWHWGMDEKQICDSVVLDTIEVNLKEKYYANDRRNK